MAVITDEIAERTAGAGVTVDGLLIKDGLLPGVTPGDIGAEVAGSAATAVSNHEIAYDHANIPSVDEVAALAAYEAALGLAEAGQVLTASGPGAAGFAAAAVGNQRLVARLSQSGSSVPVATYIHNDLAVPNFIRSAAGLYIIQFAGAGYPTATIKIMPAPNGSAVPQIACTKVVDTIFSILTVDSATNAPADNLLNSALLEIEVF